MGEIISRDSRQNKPLISLIASVCADVIHDVRSMSELGWYSDSGIIPNYSPSR
jgi:hypothetical protein